MRNCFLHCVILTGIITDAWSIQKLHTGIVRARTGFYLVHINYLSFISGFFSWLRPSVKIVDNSRLNKLFLQKRGHFFSISIIQLATISNYRASFPQFIIRINTALKFIQKKDVLIYILFLLFSICLFACFFFSVIWRHQEYLLFCYLPIINIKGIHYFRIEMEPFIKIQ